ncbi:MAG: aldehyde dehydrogenase family protein, partial [Bdellovibrionales bacterium]|nr:aldehyde dehydrogenase family protein [Bdellovibrionales bacterium]
NRYPLHIANARATNKYVSIHSPFSGEIVGEVEKADSAALEQSLQNAESVFRKAMRNMPAFKRAEILNRVADQIDDRHEELSLTIAKEGGKPLKDARVEVTRASNTTRVCAQEALQLRSGEQISMDRAAGSENHLAFTMRQPIGPVLAISAFNHPLNLMCHQMCTAFAAGNSVVAKPASQTPLSSLKLAQMFDEAGAPSGSINVVTASGAETNTLVEDSRVRFITFIGGENVGWDIRKKASPGTRIALEHGGTATALVGSSASLSKTVPSIIRGAFYHAGQVCVSTQIVYAHTSLVDELQSQLISGIKSLKTGDPTDPQTDVGPLISSQDANRVCDWIKEAVDAGASVHTGGSLIENNCYLPTLLTNTNKEMKVCSREIFGPALVLKKYTDLNATIEEINLSPYSFQAAMYTQDIDEAFHTAQQIDTKAFMINDSTAFRVDWMPFAGAKSSGLGIGGVRYSMLEMSEEKLIVTKLLQSA